MGCAAPRRSVRPRLRAWLRTGSRAALAAALVALVGGCGDGGDDRPTRAEQDAVAAAKRFLATRDAAVVCRDLVTDDFIERVFAGDRRACAGSAIADLQRDTGPVVAGVSVAGRLAKVHTRLRGGIADGAGMAYFFARERPGTTWRLDDFDTDAEQVALMILANQVLTNAGFGLDGRRRVRDCFGRKVVRMGWQTRQPLLHELLTHKRSAAREIGRLTGSCR